MAKYEWDARETGPLLLKGTLNDLEGEGYEVMHIVPLTQAGPNVSVQFLVVGRKPLARERQKPFVA
jgi:hypothetical protein